MIQMKRPISLYIIIVWFFVLFATLPTRFKSLIAESVGMEYYQLILTAMFFITLVLSYRLFKCDKFTIWFCLVFFGLFIASVNSNHIWMLIQYWQNIRSNHMGLILIIVLNVYCFVFLLLPKNRVKLAGIRQQIEIDEERKFQLKQMNLK